MIVLGILIALSMIISLFAAGLAGGSSNAPLPPEAFPADTGIPVGLVLPANALADYVSQLANLLPPIA